jgi:steroid 5-alpha reductase family enzyme
MNEKYKGLIIVLLSYLIALGFGLFSYLTLNESDIMKDSQEKYRQLVIIFICDVISTVVIWFIGVIINTASIYDPYWSVQTPIIIICLLIKYKNLNVGNLIYLELILFWGIRLTYNYSKTFHDISYIDWRYKQIREKTGKLYQIVNLLGICLFPTIIVYAASIPSFLFVIDNLNFEYIQIIGYAIIFISVCIEMKADIDIHEFKKIRNDRNEIIRIGLWKYSRHPNYFGEICFWYGVAIVYVFCDFKKNWYYIFGAVLDNALFLGISIPLAENNLKTYKDGYDEYKKNTSMLIPIKCC